MNEELIERARARAEHAYAPFSKFRVGVVVVADDGRIFEGANVENSAYGSSMCAEATAIGNAVSNGVRKIDTIAVSCIDTDTDSGYPCGNCRQLMVEFDVERLLVDGPDGIIEHTSLDDIIPYGFKLD
jgi:cytidine deaminase